MKSDLNIILLGLILILICSFTISGCASFPNNEFSKYSFDKIKPLENKVTIDYDLRYSWTERENAKVLYKFQNEVNNVFGKSNLFSKYSAGNGNSDYHFSMIMRNHGNTALSQLYGIISFFSLTLIPVKVRDNFTLSIDVKKGNKILKQYQYKHYMDTWFQLFLLPMMKSHLPNEVLYQVWDDMLLAFLYDLEQDNILVVEN